MGYTHYWTQKKNIKSADWIVMQAAMIRILAVAQAFGTSICGPEGSGSFESNTERFAFNGDESFDCSYTYVSSLDGQERRVEQMGAHESFGIERKRSANYQAKITGRSFCKTARKPYDIACTAIGCYLDTFWPEHFEFTSDGELKDWQAGLALAVAALPEKGNQLQTPRWVRDGERFQKYEFGTSKMGLALDHSGQWCIASHTVPLVAPLAYLPNEVVESVLATWAKISKGGYTGAQYQSFVKKLYPRLMKLYGRPAKTESADIGAMLGHFAEIANQQIARVTL